MNLDGWHWIKNLPEDEARAIADDNPALYAVGQPQPDVYRVSHLRALGYVGLYSRHNVAESEVP